MRHRHFITGLGKVLLYVRIALGTAWHYALRPGRFGLSPARYVRFLRRALRLLLIFRHNKVVRVRNGYKLHLYLPAYPSRAFFYTIESKLLMRPPRPTTVVFSMTKACTYKCSHCYQARDGGPDLDEGLLLQTAQNVQDVGVAMFDIEGGQPFLRYPRLLRLVRALDERSEIWVNTTGAHLEPEMLAELKKAGLFGLIVSIHSTDPDEHDALTGVPGSFHVACDALKLCRRMNLAPAVNSVLSEEAIESGGLDKLMDLARELDCDYVQLIHPKPAGAWMGRTEGMQREARVLRHIRREHLRYNSRSMRDYPSLAAQAFEESPEILGCTAGAVDRFYVNACGEVQPCEFLNISFGNVNDEPFTRVYERMRSYFPNPCCDWLCCTQAEAVHNLFAGHELKRTPVPWEIAQGLVETWNRGRPTPVYKQMGIYE